MAELIPPLIATVGPSVPEGPGLGDGTISGGGLLGRNSGALRTYINGFPIALLLGSPTPDIEIPHSEITSETICGLDLTTTHCSPSAGGLTYPAEGTIGLLVEGSPVHLNGQARGCTHTTVVTSQLSVFVGMQTPVE